MKRQLVVFWLVTGLMVALMLLSAVPDVLQDPGAVSIMKHLGYPSYLLLLLGTAKILAVVIVLVPGLQRIKEWAFAGLAIDVCGALYSHLSVGDPPSAWLPAAVGITLVGGAYVAYRRRLDHVPGTRDERTQSPSPRVTLNARKAS